MSETIVALKSVTKSYGDVGVLPPFDLALQSGEFVTLLGPSGSGKTTVLRIIGGFEAPTSGQILLNDVDITRTSPAQRPFNTVFQDYALFPHMTVMRNVGYGLMVKGVKSAVIARKVSEVLEIVGLESFRSRYPNELSGGQRQRVALARAIVCEPKVILLDEPLSALDAELRRQMQVFLKDLQRRIHTTFVFVTHDQEEAISLSDRIVVMNKGRIEQIGAPRELYYRPDTEFVAGFLGDNNLVRGEVLEDQGGHVRVATPFGTISARSQHPVALGQSVIVAIRPESIDFCGSGAPISHDRNVVQAEVESVNFVGALSQIVLRSPSQPQATIKVRCTSPNLPMELSTNAAVNLSWRVENAFALAQGKTV